ncbi:MAG TPA: amidohydrolase family protein [Lacibacter sp.]|nr:amidohydrolase family protein [Lacibacter sp.]HMO88758.1 amidohydrolase family protein [Lacibacter sp.]HMP87079.1 amidohydrolase family protein [Lacibacter sp.]
MRLIIILTLVCLQWTVAAQQATVHWKRGSWFDGNRFINTDFFSVDGILTRQPPARIDTVVDLNGRFVIPPFGEAHNHSPDVELDADVFIERYLADGIFYIKNPNSIPFTTSRLAGKINHPRSVDVVYANGGLTASGGHPEGLYRYLLQTIYRKSIPGWTERSLEGHAYYIINTAADLEKKWPFILAGKPAFIKAYLLYSEEFILRKNDTLFNGKKGLSPKLLPAIVKKARAAGLDVSCHVETPADLRNALKAGVSEINHLPGYQVRWKEGYDAGYYLIPHTTLRLMKRKGAHADATYSLSETELVETDSSRYAQRRKVQIRNLQRMKQHHIPVTVACDSYNKTARTEMEYLFGLGVYTNLELLKMWSVTTPRVIFPQRKIGYLQEGYEASFLVLNNNPLQDFSALFRIHLRVKQGELLW